MPSQSLKEEGWKSHEPVETHPHGGRVPLALVGGPRLREFYTVLEYLHLLGGEIVLDATDDGERGRMGWGGVDVVYSSAESLLEVLVDRYLTGVPDVFRRPNTLFYTWLEEHLRARQARGILYFSHVWCDLWKAEETRVRERCGLPLLAVQLDGATERDGHIRSRIAAFIEMLQ